MSTFTASNGVGVGEGAQPGWLCLYPISTSQLLHLNPNNTDALREFFRAEEDERLGRWRWPENPEFVIYPRPSHLGRREVRTVHEPSGMVSDTCEGSGLSGRHVDAARAYFEVHPAPKPWQDAKPGEVWALRSENDADEFAAVRIDGHWKAAEGGWPNEDLITAGRRIWPEEAPHE